MAKKKVTEDIDIDGGISSVLAMVKAVDDSAEIIEESSYSNIQEWVPSGNYILNACMSGDLFKAVPSGRIVTLCGPSGCGKSFLACSMCREAQKMGYTPIYMDSEGAIDSTFVKRLGVDPSKLIIKQVQTIFETSQFIANICKQLQAQQDKTGRHDKVMFVLDSLGNPTSEKERDVTMTGNQKADFTKAKDTKALFRVNATPIAKLQCIFIVCNHVYSNMSFIPQNVQSNGCILPEEHIITLENGNIAIQNVKEGMHVLSHDNEWHKIEKIWEHNKPSYTLEFEDGTIFECSDTHRFLININNPELDSSWKTAEDLSEDDEIYAINEF